MSGGRLFHSRLPDDIRAEPDSAHFRQEAQLSQRDRPTLHVIEYLAKSLNVIRNDTVEQGLCKSLSIFH